MDEARRGPVAPRRTFLIDAQPQGDVVLRVLGAFAVQGAKIVALEALQDAVRTTIRLEVAGIDPAPAAHLARRLREMPCVLGVGVGWRAAPEPQAVEKAADA